MTLPADVARCPCYQADGEWREGCEDCMRRTSPPPDHHPWITEHGAAAHRGVRVRVPDRSMTADDKPRIVAQFSCGAASAVATKLSIAQRKGAEVVIANAFVAEEDADNRRFLADCEGERFGLKDLDPSAGRHDEPMPACSFFCELAEQEYAA